MALKHTGPLRDAIRQTAAAMMASGTAGGAQFVSRFHQTYPHLINEFALFMADQWLADEGRRAAKNLSRSANLGQYELPFDMQGLDIPTAFVVPDRNGGTRWVPRHLATVEDGEAYIAVLRTNVQACLAALTDFMEFWSRVKPLLADNPGWRVGDALNALRRQQERRSEAA